MGLNVLAIIENIENFTFIDALLVSGIAILIVFAVLIVIILVSGGFSKVLEGYTKKTKICPKPENAILDEDEDAVAAALAATIDFNRETGKDARLKSITRID